MIKVCPVISKPEEFEGCKEEQCAWWNDFEKRCSVYILAHVLNQLCDTLRRREL